MLGWQIASIVGGSIVGYVLLSVILVRLPPLPWVRRRNRFRPVLQGKRHGHSPASAKKASKTGNGSCCTTKPLINDAAAAAPPPPAGDNDAAACALPGDATSPAGLLSIAHRGGSLIAPENTLLAFQRAVAANCQADLLELDIQEAADGVPIVAHDSDLLRICGTAGTVREDVRGADPSKLPLLSTNIALHFHGSEGVSHYQMPPEDEATVGRQRLCTLEEVLTAFPNTPLHIDVKWPSERLTRRVLDMLTTGKFANRGSITVLGSGGDANGTIIHDAAAKLEKAHRAAAQQGKKVGERSNLTGVGAADKATASNSADGAAATPFATFSSFAQVVKVYLLYYSGLLPFVPLDFDVFDLPLPTAPLKQRLTSAASKRGCCAGVLASLVGWLITAPALWAHLRKRGIWVFGFVQNQRLEFDEAATEAWPIDGIMTDDPVALRAWLDDVQSQPQRF